MNESRLKPYEIYQLIANLIYCTCLALFLNFLTFGGIIKFFIKQSDDYILLIICLLILPVAILSIKQIYNIIKDIILKKVDIISGTIEEKSWCIIPRFVEFVYIINGERYHIDLIRYIKYRKFKIGTKIILRQGYFSKKVLTIYKDDNILTTSLNKA